MYYSDKQKGERPRNKERISPNAWGGIVSLINSNITNGGFGISFPEECPDGNATIGTNRRQLELSAKAEISNIKWPLETTTKEDGFMPEEKPHAPSTLDILDLIEFCHNNIAEPIQRGYHKFYRHFHITFDKESGQSNFRNKINKIFSRNGLAYKIEENGQIIRISSPELSKVLNNTFSTTDNTLNNMLTESRNKFLNPDPKIRKEALERLWDSWERIKTLKNPNNKKDSTKKY